MMHLMEGALAHKRFMLQYIILFARIILDGKYIFVFALKNAKPMGPLFGKNVYHYLLILYNSKVTTIDLIRIGFKVLSNFRLFLLTRETSCRHWVFFFSD